MSGSIIQQGRFTSDGSVKRLAIRSDVDWIEVINYTVADANQTTAIGVQYYWQRGMAAGTGIEYKKSNAANAANLTDAMASGGFTLLDTSDETPGAELTGTTITKADPPVCTITSHGFSTGDRVRIYSSDEMDQINGLEFHVTSTGANTFTLTYLDTNTGNFTASTEFKARKIPNPPAYLPQRNVIASITQASSAVVEFLTTHNYSVGDVLRFNVPSVWGMVEINGLQGKITAVSTANNTVTVNVDSSAFTAFAWPAATSAPLTHASTVPVGDNSTNSLADAIDNTALIGIELGSGADGPAGQNNDVVYWRAGKSFSVSNE